MRATALCSALLLAACGGGSGAVAVETQRVLGIHVSEAQDGDFDAAATLALGAGAGALHLHLDWSQLEPSPETYDATFPDIANTYYPARGIPLYLTLRPINTVRREVPSDLEAVAWDDPVMMARFRALLDFLFARIGNVDVRGLAVGNELGGVLTTPADFTAYATFLRAARDHARSLRPGLPVGTTVTFPDLMGANAAQYQTLNAETDFISVTYYPLDAASRVRAPNSALADFDALVALYPGREIVVQECGYPSSADTGSSESMQAEFVRAVFQAWDRHADAISHLAFEHLHDWSSATIDEFTVYYGSADPAFRGFLASIGLRNHDGTPKAGWSALVEEATARTFGDG